MNTTQPTGSSRHAVQRAQEIDPEIEDWRHVLAWWERSEPISGETVQAITQRRGAATDSGYRLTPCGRGIMVHSTTTGAIVTVLRMSPRQQAILRPVVPVVVSTDRILAALHSIDVRPHVTDRMWRWQRGPHVVNLDLIRAGWKVYVRGPIGSVRQTEADSDAVIALILSCFRAT